jgi:heme-degrading monooxygenase HmoA
VNLRPRSDSPDLHTQLESLLDQVWRSEADWRLWDRLDAVHAQESARRKRTIGRPTQETA